MKDMMGDEELKWRYDVFLCFRGQDTRHTFAGTLYNALQQAGFKTFMYHGAFKSGDQIKCNILEAIESSRISIVVLSPYYTSSSWCLDDLCHVLRCHKENNQVVLPIFYDVDPSDVRHQRASFGEAMDRHKDRFGEGSDRVRKWTSALSQIPNFSDWCFPSGGYEYEYQLIEKIVQHVTELVQRYDIFLSFCGKDTRFSFTGFLYNALCQSGFKTFMNDIDEDQISQSTVEAIEKSRLSIIVFSENYARSSSSLDELLTIIECMNKKKQLVWSIFYKVEPSDLRHQRNSYGEAMTEHENMLGTDSLKLQNWRAALFDVANLKGWHLKIGYEYQLIEKIVEMATKI